MTTATRNLIIRALGEYRGDNYERAQAAFRNCPPQVMQEQYGWSGKTRQELLDGYKTHVDAVEAAIAEIKGVPRG